MHYEYTRSILCPGLGTAVGRMPVTRCAVQMRVAYQAVMLSSVDAINRPQALSHCCSHHVNLYQVSFLSCNVQVRHNNLLIKPLLLKLAFESAM